MGFPLPDWLFSWHILLIAIGLFLGLRHNFRGGAWLILILVGGCFLIQDFYPKTELRRFIGPCVLIFIGFIIMFRPRNRWRNHPWKDDWREHLKEKWRHHEWQKHQWKKNQWDKSEWNKSEWNRPWNPPGTVGGSGFSGPGGPNNPGGPNSAAPTDQPVTDPTGTAPSGVEGVSGQSAQTGPAGPETTTGAGQGQTSAGPGQNSQSGAYSNGYSSEDYIDTTSIFGGVHKKVVSKNFRGGDVVTFLGGSEIDLSQAEIIGTARLDVTQVMGGTKIIVPAHWEVRSEVTALFAGFEDKRQQPAMINPEKVLIIDGTSIFGGIELKNY